MRRTVLIASLAVGLSAVGASSASAASCGSLKDPFAGTRFSDSAVRSIRASGGASCAAARTLAEKATYRGLLLGTPSSGIRRYTINGFRVRYDTRGKKHAFTAKNGRQRVSWVS